MAYKVEIFQKTSYMQCLSDNYFFLFIQLKHHQKQNDPVVQANTLATNARIFCLGLTQCYIVLVIIRIIVILRAICKICFSHFFQAILINHNQKLPFLLWCSSSMPSIIIQRLLQSNCTHEQSHLRNNQHFQMKFISTCKTR